VSGEILPLLPPGALPSGDGPQCRLRFSFTALSLYADSWVSSEPRPLTELPSEKIKAGGEECPHSMVCGPTACS
jgi:hypothetical protein